MKHDLYWFDELQQVLILKFQNEITWDEFHVMIDTAHEKIKSQKYVVDLVLWYKFGRLPPGNPLVQFQSVVKRQPKNTGRVVVINPDLNTGLGKYIAVIAGIIEHLSPRTKNVQLVSTYEEACKRLNLVPRQSIDK